MQRYVEGHINESVERRNFRRRVQQPGEAFGDFLVSLRELAKTCNFCSIECTQKNIRDQIIEGLMDGDTVEDLLQEKDLTLPRAITKYQGQEAAKRQRAEMTRSTPEAISAIRKGRSDKVARTTPQTCPGCGASSHQGGRRHCPAYGLTCYLCQKTGHFAKVCRKRPAHQPTPMPPAQPRAHTKAIYVKSSNERGSPRIHLSNVRDGTAIELAPTITVHVSSLNGSADMELLPDSCADISAAGKETLRRLGEHVDNLLPSKIEPQAVNGSRMRSIGKIPRYLSTRQDDVPRRHPHLPRGCRSTPVVESSQRSWHPTRVLPTPRQHHHLCRR